jgi:hypothetical protein
MRHCLIIIATLFAAIAFGCDCRMTIIARHGRPDLVRGIAGDQQWDYRPTHIPESAGPATESTYFYLNDKLKVVITNEGCKTYELGAEEESEVRSILHRLE